MNSATNSAIHSKKGLVVKMPKVLHGFILAHVSFLLSPPASPASPLDLAGRLKDPDPEERDAALRAVAALPGAQSGRMDLSRDGPRFGHRKPDPESPKKWAAKLAAKKAARHRAFLVHLGQHPIH